MSCRLTYYLKTEFGKAMAKCATDQERYRFLILQFNIWSQKYARFVAAGQTTDDLAAEFMFGPYGHITAGDFLIVLGMIDAEKVKLERQRVPA